MHSQPKKVMTKSVKAVDTKENRYIKGCSGFILNYHDSQQTFTKYKPFNVMDVMIVNTNQFTAWIIIHSLQIT